MHVIKISLPLDESILCFGYRAIASRLDESFAGVAFGDWAETAEYDSLEKSLAERADTPIEMKATMQAQIRTKHISNGPSIPFSYPSSGGDSVIQGTLRRWSVRFWCEQPFSEIDDKWIVNFLRSLGVGEIEKYNDSD